MITCIVITRDRLSVTKLCLESLAARKDQLEIHVVDHGSTWEPMVEYLKSLPFPVHYRGDQPPRSLWEWQKLDHLVGPYSYIVTDPDVVIDDDCPSDWVDQLKAELRHENVIKVGLGLKLSDLPDTPLAAKVKEWENAFWISTTGCVRGFYAPVDTTLAIYHPLTVTHRFKIHPAVRLGPPYLVRHLPWYGDLDPVESDYYRDHLIPGSSHWAFGGWEA